MSHIPASRLVETFRWFVEHLHHRDYQRLRITEEDAGHPTGTMFRWRCECGAAHVSMGAAELDAFRASGDCICDQCGVEYRKHPSSFHRSYDDQPYLVRLCDGSLVKL